MRTSFGINIEDINFMQNSKKNLYDRKLPPSNLLPDLVIKCYSMI